MLQCVREHCPDLYPLVHSSYSAESLLFWESRTIPSAEGIQQGDPLGPLLFCLSIHGLVSSLNSEFCVSYLDDISIGSHLDVLKEDITLIRSAHQMGLVLNPSKSEVVCSSSETSDKLLRELPGACIVDPSKAVLLGSPIGDIDSIDLAIQNKITSLRLMGERLCHFSRHDAILLLRHSFSIPRLLYLLRTAPAFLAPSLVEYDTLSCSLLSSITNVPLSSDSLTWIQASLPVKYGGLGFRSAVQLAPSCFLSSAAASQELTSQILPQSLQSIPLLYKDEALSCWSSRIPNPVLPSIEDVCRQKAWDLPHITYCQDFLLSNTPDVTSRARLMAVFAPEAGAWLQALPISALGLRMDDDTVRIAVALRLGLPICTPHTCQHCGVRVDAFAHHGLSCLKNSGRCHRHAAVNNVIYRAMASAGIPSTLEPSGLSRSDGKRPDGLTSVPWTHGRSLVWDVTVPDTLAPSYRPIAVTKTGGVAARAESQKEIKYHQLALSYLFSPIAIESLGAVGPKSWDFLVDLGRRIKMYSGENKAFSYLIQRLSVAVQRGNATLVRGTLPSLTVDLFS